MNSAFYNALAHIRQELATLHVDPKDFNTAIEWAITMSARPRYYLPLYVDYVYPVAMYREFRHNYLSVRSFAQDHGMEPERVRPLLELGKALHQIEMNFDTDIEGAK